MSVLEVNNIFSQLLDYSEEEIKGNSIEQVISDKDIEKLHNNWESIRKGQTVKDLFSLKSKTGKTWELSVSFSPLKDKEEYIRKILFLAVEQ